MKEKVVFGEKAQRKHLIGYWLAFSFFGFVGATGIYNILRVYFYVPFMTYFTVAIIIYCMIVIFLMPLAGSNERIEFDNDSVSYYRIKGYFNLCKEVKRIIKDEKEIAEISVKTKDIFKINLSYLMYIGFRGHIAYRLKITFLLKDGTMFYLFPITTGQMETGDYEKAFLLLENNGIEIVDKLGLRPHLSQNMYDFQKYAASIERGKNKC